MDLRDLEWLVALDATGHVTDTAAALGTTQPTLSRTVARVEAELGTRLFERLPHGVATTPDGDLVVQASRELVDRWRRLRAELDGRLDPDGGVVRLAFLDSMATSLVPRLLRAFHEDAPRARVVLRQEPNHDILADLRSGAAELAVTSPRPEGPFAWLPLQEERLVVVVPPTHRWARRRRLRVAELADEPLVTTPVGFGFRAIVDTLLAEAGVVGDVAFESADLATIEGLVAAGLGVALVPQQLAGASGTVGIPVDAAGARRTVGLTWRSDRRLAPPAARLLGFVRARRRAGDL
ncbi:LysR family transcriptional regulator [Arthrobacter sp. NEB 688]|uniref:LysR family transcriptional regulator n=1 Tax=Arthrobacter sp. NEB 688 TaxID=904039 RepID=UPI001563DF0A|nr:LysR family transcriptional regulator [Arthrobacter sp. NEB 688]QKE85816.1 LysR family transcriptional regulator [Arthrobacter sp. NEB 688]